MHKILLAMLIIVMLGAVSPARSQPIQVTDAGIGWFDPSRTDQLTIIERRTSGTVDQIYGCSTKRCFGGWIAIGAVPISHGFPLYSYKWRFTKPSGEQSSLMGPYSFYNWESRTGAAFGTLQFDAPPFERNPNGTWTIEFFVWNRDTNVNTLVATRTLQVTSTTSPPPPTVTPPPTGTMPPTGTPPTPGTPTSDARSGMGAATGRRRSPLAPTPGGHQAARCHFRVPATTPISRISYNPARPTASKGYRSASSCRPRSRRRRAMSGPMSC